MSIWTAAAVVLACGFVPCALVARRDSVSSGLTALNLAGVLTLAILLVLCAGFGRQAFVDLAIVLGPMSLVGLLAFLRFLERRG
jgi:multicomponent Na+:H+ antiporter subunit F